MKIIKWLDKNLEEAILVVLLIFMTLILGLQIVMRYAFQNSLSWSEEIVRFMFVWSGFISVPFCIKHSSSIRIDIVRNILPKSIEKFMKIVEKIIIFSLFAVLTYFSIDVVRSTLYSGQTSTAVGLPMWIVQFSTTLAFALSCVRTLQNFIKVLHGEEAGV